VPAAGAEIVHAADAKRSTGASMHRTDIVDEYYQLDSLQLKN
jgi:hypothetical protein